VPVLTFERSPRVCRISPGAAYGDVVERAREHVFAGDVFQVVPSQQFTRSSAVNPLTLYRVLRALNPSPYMYLLDSGDIQIVGASPEMLMRVHDGLVSYRPIAGTRLAASTKPRPRTGVRTAARREGDREHVMLVDLGETTWAASPPGDGAGRSPRPHRALLAPHAFGVTRRGPTKGRSRCLRRLRRALSGGTLTAPQGARDGTDRRVRTGISWTLRRSGRLLLALGNADFAITIRTVSLRGGVATVQAGGGVVADSQPEFEYEESINKASAPLLALEIADPIS